MSQTVSITPQDIGRTTPPIVAAFDLAKVSRILRRNAVAASFQANTRLEWKRYEDLVVQFFSIGEPGIVEIEIASNDKIDKDLNRFYQSNLKALGRVSRKANGAAVLEFLEKKEAETQHLQLELRCLYNEARRLNNEIRQEAAWTTDKLFAIKVSAEVIYAGAGVLSGVGLISGCAGGLTYGLASNVAMTRHELMRSDLVAYVKQEAKKPIPSNTVGLTVGVGGSAAMKKAADAVSKAGLAMEVEAASLKAYQENIQPYQQMAPRQLKNANLHGKGNLAKGPTTRLAQIKGAAKLGGFMTSLYFLKDDIAKAMNGYSRSMGY